LIEFKSDVSVVKELETSFKRDERVIRFLTVRLDKHAVAYSEKKRNKKEAELPRTEEKVDA
jgi:small subunit ribosomal protein S6